MKHPRCLPAFILLLLLLTEAGYGAAVTLTNSDTNGQTSFLAKGNWSSGAAPSSGNTYSVAGGLSMRTGVSPSSETFGGDTLTIGDGSGSLAQLLYYGTSASTILVTNLVLNNGAFVNNSPSNAIPGLAGNITLASGGGTFDAGGAQSILLQTNSAISGSGNLTLTNSGAGTGTVTFAGTNAYTGATIVASNTVGVFSSLLGSVVSTNYVYTSNITNNGSLSFNTLGATNQVLSNGVISGTGSLIHNSGTSGLYIYSTNTYSGGTTVQAGGIHIYNASALGTGTITLSGGNLYAETNMTVTNNYLLAASTTSRLYASGSGVILTNSGVISGSGNLTTAANLSGSPIVVLTGVNTYTGNTTILSGTLKLGGAGQLGSGSYAGSITNSNFFIPNFAIGRR